MRQLGVYSNLIFTMQTLLSSAFKSTCHLRIVFYENPRGSPSRKKASATPPPPPLQPPFPHLRHRCQW
jgi:hypothetical protein